MQLGWLVVSIIIMVAFEKVCHCKRHATGCSDVSVYDHF